MAKRKKTPDILGELLGVKKGDERTFERTGSKDPFPGSKQNHESLPHQGKRKPTQRQASPKEVQISRQIIHGQEEKMEKLPGGSENFPQTASGSPEKKQRTPFVTFELGGSDYALPLEQVGRALRMVALLPVPEAPSWIAGLMNLQGQAIPVLDLRKRFGKPAKDPHPDDRLLVVQNPVNTFAVMVDKVNDVLEVPFSEIEAPSGSLSKSRPLKGVIRHEEKLILVLDPDQLDQGKKLTIEYLNNIQNG
jgi:purine-binding chemotaxis protein CheW